MRVLASISVELTKVSDKKQAPLIGGAGDI